MQAEIIALGDELTSGQRLNTNSQWLSRQLADCGIRVLYHTTAGDDWDAGRDVFRQAIQRADVIVSTGGLGPTADDLARECLAEACGVELVRDEAALEHIRALFARRGREMPERNAVQALFPRGSRPIPNPHGTAPGIEMQVPRAGRGPAWIFALPGVPAEMREMWTATVRGALAALPGADRHIIRHRAIHCFGTGESAIEAMLPDLIRRGRVPAVGITASQATITLRITAEGATPEACAAAMQPTADTIYQCLGDLVFGEEGDTLQSVVIRLLAERGQTLGTVECGSGGLLAQWLSAADPAGRVYRGGWVLRDPVSLAAAIEAARPLPDTSAPLAPAAVQTLASRCRTNFRTDYALALGPFPPSDESASAPPPVQLAVAHGSAVYLRATPYAGHPDMLQARIAKDALNLLRLRLLAGRGGGAEGTW